MNDLEDLWDSYPTSEPPTGDLLREARRRERARRRRMVLRPLLAGGAVAALGSAFIVGTHVGGAGRGSDEAGTTAGGGPALRHSAFQADLKAATSCDQLLASYRERGAAAVTAYGWVGSVSALGATEKGPFASAPQAADGAAAGGALNGAVSGADLSGADISGQGSSQTGTNVQEVGVDEPDDVKTDGSLVVRVQDATLSVYDASGSTVQRVASLTLPHLADAEILLSGHTVVAVGSDTVTPDSAEPAGTRIETVSIADPAAPVVTSDVTYAGTAASVRQHGSVIRAVLASAPPALDFVQPRKGLTPHEALVRNRAVVRASTLADWLPTYDDGSGPRPLLACTDVAIPPAGLPLGTESIVGFDASSPTAPVAIGVAGQTGVAYESSDHLYLATSGGATIVHGGLVGVPMTGDAVGGAIAMPCCGAAQDRAADDRTTIFQFDLDGTRAVHVATGKVEGAIADRWSMDEAGGVLRVAVTRAGDHGRSSSVLTLRPAGAELAVVGHVDGLGVDETLTAARWFDDLAILSTARQTDPLYTVDLSDPAKPRLVGALHIPGYSTYFHPIGGGLLIGVGQKVAFDKRGEREQAQVGLFDIADLADVHQLDVAPVHRWTWPVAADDPRAFTWLADRSTALTTFTTRGASVVLGEYHVAGDHFEVHLRTLATGDPSQVRTLELTDGRVVLMAGDALSFLDL